MEIDHLDHLVLTVRDMQATCDFFTHVLGMTVITLDGGRHALKFGQQKINLHEAGHELEPKAERPVPGSADVCLIANTPLGEIIAHLQACHVPLVAGPVERAGARGPIRSVYIRDPDGNLIEIANECA